MREEVEKTFDSRLSRVEEAEKLIDQILIKQKKINYFSVFFMASLMVGLFFVLAL